MGVGMGEADRKIPYYGIKLTKEQAKIVENAPAPKWYESDGKHVFEVKDKYGKPTGEYMAYILFA